LSYSGERTDMSHLKLAAALFASLAFAIAQAQPAAQPALVPAQHPGEPILLPDMPLHDPLILAYAPTKTYYLYTSNVRQMTGVNGAGTMAYTSKDLKHWTAPKVVFTVPEGFWAEQGAWAPEVHEYHGKFYLFTTLHNESKPLPQSGRPVG